MSQASHSRGFMKGAVVFTVAASLVMIILFQLSQHFSSGNSLTVFSGPSTGVSDSNLYDGRTNPLLNFGNLPSNQYYGGESGRTIPNVDGAFTSPYAGKVTLSLGTARSSNQPYEEYITVTSRSDTPVSITGWTVANGKGSRPIENIQNNYVYPVADSATIGMGTEFLSPDGNFQTGSIVLKRGDQAHLATGKAFSQFPFSIYTSFRENKCVGYLRNYPFAPAVSRSCPHLANDPQIRTVTDPCYDYIRSLNSCEDPQRYDKEDFDLLTTQCRDFITPRVGYAGCVAYNKDSRDFSLNRWRVFLGKERELWASSRETITLYDAQGFIVDMVTY